MAQWGKSFLELNVSSHIFQKLSQINSTEEEPRLKSSFSLHASAEKMIPNSNVDHLESSIWIDFHAMTRVLTRLLNMALL